MHNQLLRDALQTTTNHLLTRHWFSTFIPLVDQDSACDQWAAIVAGNSSVTTYTSSLVAANGTIVRVCWTNACLREFNGEFFASVSIGHVVVGGEEPDLRVQGITKDLFTLGTS